MSSVRVNCTIDLLLRSSGDERVVWGAVVVYGVIVVFSAAWGIVVCAVRGGSAIIGDVKGKKLSATIIPGVVGIVGVIAATATAVCRCPIC